MKFTSTILGVLAAGLFNPAGAQMAANPAAVAERVRQIGPVINPPETAKLYAPLQPQAQAGEFSIERDAAYGPDGRHRLDVFSPVQQPARPRPVLVFVHGGGFVAGNKTAPGSPFYDNVMAWAARNQMVGVSVTYRLAPQNVWPAAREDLVAALGWVGANIGRYGGDPKRVYLVGHSAGGTHVASVVAEPAAMRSVRAAGVRVAGAALVSAVYDLSTFPPGPSPKAYFGDNAAYYAQQSPLTTMPGSRVPLLVTTAELDPPEFRVQHAAAVKALCQRGRCPASLDLAGHSHMSEIYALGTADRELGDALLKFFAATAQR